MNKFTCLAITLLMAFSLTLTGIQEAEAKRFGGARSFGSKPSYRTPYRKSNRPPNRSASQQKAYQKNQTARQTLNKRGGLMGMLGGLALGGMLGALFFGGAFEGLNFMDILVFAGIAYFLYKLFAPKSIPVRQSAYQKTPYPDIDDRFAKHSNNKNSGLQSSAGFNTDVLFNKNRTNHSGQNADTIDADFKETFVSNDFDTDTFLTGAKSAFKQLQNAWDNEDLSEIRGLTTDKVFAEIQDQIKSNLSKNQTDVLKIDAGLLEVREVGQTLEAVVLFDAIIREENNRQAEQVREIWHFIRPVNSSNSTWLLDGIQQMEQ